MRMASLDEYIYSRVLGALEDIPESERSDIYDVIAMQNLAANPPGVADEFIEWCRNF
jgi:hypothetical protein